MYYPLRVTIHKRSCPNCGHVFSSSLFTPAIRLGPGKRFCKCCYDTFLDESKEWNNLSPADKRTYVFQGIGFLGVFFLLFLVVGSIDHFKNDNPDPWYFGLAFALGICFLIACAVLPVRLFKIMASGRRTSVDGLARQQTELSKQRELKKQADHNQQVQIDEMLKVKGPTLFTTVCTALEKDVTEFNATNQNRKIDFKRTPEDHVIVSLPLYPLVRLELWLDLNSRLVRFTTMAKKNSETSPRMNVGDLKIQVSTDGSLHLVYREHFLNIEDTRTLFLTPFFSKR